MSNAGQDQTARARQAPRFRRATVARLEPLTRHLVRATVAGPELEGFRIDEPAASIRLLLPTTGSTDLVMPDWSGNEFLLPDGGRPLIRTFTPRYFDPEVLELDIDIVLHDGGAASAWTGEAGAGDPVAITDPGRGYRIDPTAPGFFLAGDETAIPAIGQLLEEIPETIPVQVVIEIAHPDARLDLPTHAAAEVEWAQRDPGSLPGAGLITRVQAADIAVGTRVWVAGEAGSLVPIRRNLFEERELPRTDVTVRGYWKHGR